MSDSLPVSALPNFSSSSARSIAKFAKDVKDALSNFAFYFSPTTQRFDASNDVGYCIEAIFIIPR